MAAAWCKVNISWATRCAVPAKKKSETFGRSKHLPPACFRNEERRQLFPKLGTTLAFPSKSFPGRYRRGEPAAGKKIVLRVQWLFGKHSVVPRAKRYYKGSYDDMAF
jgi:hypothetical protein